MTKARMLTAALKRLGRIAALWPRLPRYNPQLTRGLAQLRDAPRAAPTPRPEGGAPC